MESHLERLRQVLDAAITGMSEEELSWHPEGKWCTVEVLEHLYFTYAGTVKGCERVLEKGKPLATAATWRQRLAAWVVNGAGFIPQGRKAPESTRPRGLARETVVGGFGAKIAEMDEIIARCEAQFGGRVKLMDHPFLGPLTGAGWRKFHLRHGLHHAKQIRALRAGWAETARGKSF